MISLSKVITAVRFPMILLVVLLHTIILGQTCLGEVYIREGDNPVFDGAAYTLLRCIGDVAVPMFFFISGYLFFLCKGEFTFDVWKSKVKRRVGTLLVPYILWNAIYLLYLLLIYYLFPSIQTSSSDFIKNFTVGSVVTAFWGGLYECPVLAPLWFIRNLMVLVLFSYPIYFVIRRVPALLYVLLLSLFGLWIFKIGLDVFGVGVHSSLFYVMGAFFSIKQVDLMRLISRYAKFVCLLYCMMVVADVILWRNGWEWLSYYHQFLLIIGLFAMFGVIYLLAKYSDSFFRFISSLAKYSFFVYAAHMFIMNIPNKFWPLLLPVNTFTLISMQILIPIFVSFLLIMLYKGLDRIAPRCLSVLCGGR